MPSSVMLAIGMYISLIGFSVFSHDIKNSPLQFLVLWGLFSKSRLAWQWGRFVPFLVGIGITLFLIIILITGKWSLLQNSTLMFMLGIRVPCLVIGFSLNQESAKNYFGLFCPQCGSKKTKAANFFFTEVKCSQCGNRWR